MSTDKPLAIPFGKYRDQPLGMVPRGYLLWLLDGDNLSGSLRVAVVDELRRRGVQIAVPTAPRQPKKCKAHPASGTAVRWWRDRLGRRHVRAFCRECGKAVDFLPAVEPYSTAADAAEAEGRQLALAMEARA
jgi:uncharacterized protein (DUF3820 family)